MSITVVGTEMFREFNALMASVCVLLTTLAQHCTGAVAHRTFGVGVGVGVGFPQPLDADGPNFDLCESATGDRQAVGILEQGWEARVRAVTWRSRRHRHEGSCPPYQFLSRDACGPGRELWAEEGGEYGKETYAPTPLAFAPSNTSNLQILE